MQTQLPSGYTLKSVIQENARFSVCEILDRHGSVFIFKSVAKDEEKLLGRLENQIWFYQTINHLKIPQLICPTIINSSTHWYIAQKVTGHDIFDIQTSTNEVIRQNIPQIIGIIQALDSLPVRDISVPSTASKIALNLNSLADEPKNWAKLDKVMDEKYLNPSDLDRAIELIKTYSPYVSPRLQHTDFVPEHIRKANDSSIYLIDSERSGLENPRYYDLAYLYTRLVTKRKDFTSAKQLLGDYLTTSGTNASQFQKSFWSVFTLRSLGMLVDAYADRHSIDYLPEAQQLLALCFEERLENLI